MADSTLGKLVELWRFPVKSMQGERVEALTVQSSGVVGDRAHALIDVATGNVVSAKSAKLFPTVLQCRAEFVHAPVVDAPAPVARSFLPDGSVVDSDAGNANQRLSAWFKRDVQLARTAPASFTIDMHQPELGTDDAAAGQGTTVQQKLGAALFAAIGASSPVPVGSFLDLFPMSVLTTATLAELRKRAPNSNIDARRFRMNAVIDTGGTGHDRGFPENDWTDLQIRCGADVTLRVVMPDPRCVMVTLKQADLDADMEVLRALTQHNRIKTAWGELPCAGVYAAVEAEGGLRVGDPVLRV